MINLVLSPSQQAGTEEPLIKPIAQRLYDMLRTDNLVNVALVPYFEGDDETALWNAIQWSNNWISQNGGQGYHFALHADAGAYARGASGLYFSDNGKAFITPVTQAIMDLTPWPDVGIKYRNNLGELKNTTAIAGLLEISFYDNSEELAWMKNNVNLIADTIKNGIYKALGITKPINDPKYRLAYVSLYKDLVNLTDKYKEEL